MSKHHRRESQHGFPRTARVSEVVREIVATELERIDDDRLTEVTVTEVRVDPDLRHAHIWFDALAGPDADAEVLAALHEHRVRLQAAIGRNARMKRTPQLDFAPDDVLRSAERLDKLMRPQADEIDHEV
jgi:ribosome-binding factor A